MDTPRGCAMLVANAMSGPPLSVIVACKNPGSRLAAALESVWIQRDTQPELIVIDGASTDGTREWLEARRARLTALVSEPDRGVYDALNKGVALARGDWLLFLGADDRLVGDTILGTFLNWVKHTESGVAVGEIAYHDGRLYRLGSHVRPLARNFVHHQGAFYRRALFTEGRAFDPSFAIMADYEFNLRLWKSRVRFKPIPLRIAACGTRGLSDSGRWLGYREEIAIRHRYAPAWRCWFWDALSLVRWLARKVFTLLRLS
ncbi:MAG TPA: glycosyltransferase family 2 protein, partial [Opitutus sp.]|nr:glycosyltransferase family 2 protein [Opitutus sp.]